MSSLAINAIGDEPITATEYRSEFLRDGVKYPQFLCPFCHIHLSPIAIYVIEESVKSPHFRKQTEHIGKCDGEPIFINVEKREPKKYIPPKDMTFPEAFIKRRRPRITTTINTGSHRGPLSLDEINEARVRAGLGGAHRSTATILQPFVYAYNHVWKEGFRIYPGDIKKSDRNTWIRGVLSEAPLHLGRNNVTNYYDAFRYLNFYSTSLERIYRGEGVVTTLNGVYQISGKCMIKRENKELAYEVRIDPLTIDSDEPRSQIDFLSQLEKYCSEGTRLRWYAFGLVEVSNSLIALNVKSLDDVFLTKAYLKNT